MRHLGEGHVGRALAAKTVQSHARHVAGCPCCCRSRNVCLVHLQRQPPHHRCQDGRRHGRDLPHLQRVRRRIQNQCRPELYGSARSRLDRQRAQRLSKGNGLYRRNHPGLALCQHVWRRRAFRLLQDFPVPGHQLGCDRRVPVGHRLYRAGPGKPHLHRPARGPGYLCSGAGRHRYGTVRF